MNVQRGIALAVVLGTLVIVVTSNAWLPVLLERGKKETATPTSTAVADVSLTPDSLAPTLAGGVAALPTVDPLVVSLMQAAGMQQLAIGDEPFIIYAGDFTVIDPMHRADGTASIYKIGDKQRILRLDPFQIVSGADLHVILSKHPEPRTSAEALQPQYVDLGPLQNTSGAQNYLLPDDADISKYQSVVIYSMSSYLIFSTATLEQVRG